MTSPRGVRTAARGRGRVWREAPRHEAPDGCPRAADRTPPRARTTDRSDVRPYTDTTVSGIPESVVMSSDDGATPARRHAEPSAAIIAPLSVQ